MREPANPSVVRADSSSSSQADVPSTPSQPPGQDARALATLPPRVAAKLRAALSEANTLLYMWSVYGHYKGDEHVVWFPAPHTVAWETLPCALPYNERAYPVASSCPWLEIVLPTWLVRPNRVVPLHPERAESDDEDAPTNGGQRDAAPEYAPAVHWRQMFAVTVPVCFRCHETWESGVVRRMPGPWGKPRPPEPPLLFKNPPLNKSWADIVEDDDSNDSDSKGANDSSGDSNGHKSDEGKAKTSDRDRDRDRDDYEDGGGRPSPGIAAVLRPRAPATPSDSSTRPEGCDGRPRPPWSCPYGVMLMSWVPPVYPFTDDGRSIFSLSGDGLITAAAAPSPPHAEPPSASAVVAAPSTASAGLRAHRPKEDAPLQQRVWQRQDVQRIPTPNPPASPAALVGRKGQGQGQGQGRGQGSAAPLPVPPPHRRRGRRGGRKHREKRLRRQQQQQQQQQLLQKPPHTTPSVDAPPASPLVRPSDRDSAKERLRRPPVSTPTSTAHTAA